jgi:signal transduction histidine kinase
VDVLLHDERVRVVLRQLPRFLSTTVPLADKLDELCDMAAGVLYASCAAVVMFEDGRPRLTHTDEVAPEVLERLRDPQQVRATTASTTVVRQDDQGCRGLLTGLRNEADTYGALYVARCDPVEPFTAEEEEVLQLFAEAVGPALHHGARMLNTERAERWGAAAVRLTERFLAEESDDPYTTIVDEVWELAEADAVGVMVPRGDQVAIAAVRGLGLESHHGSATAMPSVFSLDILRRRGGLVLDHLGSQSAWLTTNRPDLDLGPLMAVPLQGAKGPLGVLYLVRRAGSPPFTTETMRIAETFAVNAALSMEWHAARRTHDELRMLQERNRIARDLHDNVVQRLFATGLYLQQASRTLDGEPQQRVLDAMTAIDQTIRQIRNTILVLRSTAADRLDKLLTTIVAETTPLLGFPPTITMSPDVSRVTGPLAADLALCVREALSNVVQHARATSVSVDVAVAPDDTVVLEISDDGVGIHGQRRPGGGLENLDERARAHCGTFTYDSEPGRGTTLRWRMPLTAS